jgi:hypothetical protein
VTIDPQPPRLFARLRDGGIEVEASDVVGPIRIELTVDGVTREVVPVDGFVSASIAPDQSVSVAAIDGAGNRTEVALAAGVPDDGEAAVEQTGCVCVTGGGGSVWMLFGLLFLVRRRS